MKFAFISEQKVAFSIVVMCRVFEVSYCSGKRDGLDAVRVVGARQRGRTPGR